MKQAVALGSSQIVAPRVAGPGRSPQLNDRRAWAAIFGGGALGLAVYSYQLLTGAFALSLASLRWSPLGSLVTASSFEPMTLLMALGLFLFLGGLLAQPSEEGLGARPDIGNPS